MKGIKKTVYTLNIGNYHPEITAITYPLIKYWAHKIGADFHIITERKFPEWPVTYEKLQIFELSKEHGNDWNIYVDSDAVIHPDTLDWTNYLSKDTIAHNGRDFANVRWRYNDYFRRDGRNWGSCNWFTIASDWCRDIWTPLDIPLEEALDHIFPTHAELNGTTNSAHLIDDFALSYNIARFGIKAKILMDIQKELGFGDSAFHFHLYNVSEYEKMNGYVEMIDGKEVKRPGIVELVEKTWGIPKSVRNYAG